MVSVYMYGYASIYMVCNIGLFQSAPHPTIFTGAPPSIVVKCCGGWCFVWSFVVLFLYCRVVCCSCCVCDLFLFSHFGLTHPPGRGWWYSPSSRHLWALLSVGWGGVVRVVVCLWCCSCRVVVCVTCFSCYRSTYLELYPYMYNRNICIYSLEPHG